MNHVNRFASESATRRNRYAWSRAEWSQLSNRSRRNPSGGPWRPGRAPRALASSSRRSRTSQVPWSRSRPSSALVTTGRVRSGSLRRWSRHNCHSFDNTADTYLSRSPPVVEGGMPLRPTLSLVVFLFNLLAWLRRRGGIGLRSQSRRSQEWCPKNGEDR